MPNRSLPSTTSIFAILVLAVGSWASSAAADCDDDPANLLSTFNCGFDSDVAGWTQTTGNVPSWLMNVGDPDLGALEMADTVLPPNPLYQSQVISACFPLNGGINYDFGLRMQALDNGGVLLSCAATLDSHSDAACLTRINQSTFNFNPGTGSFQLYSGATTTPAAATSGRILVTCSGGSAAPFSAALDNVYLGEGLSLPVQLQSFNVE